jgi:hypothetical protein
MNIKSFTEYTLGDDQDRINLIQGFVDYAESELTIKEPYDVYLLDSWASVNEDKHTHADFNTETSEIRVIYNDRSVADVCRSIAHELVHKKQKERGLLTDPNEDGQDGSPIENQANAMAGVLIRQYAKMHENFYSL